MYLPEEEIALIQGRMSPAYDGHLLARGLSGALRRRIGVSDGEDEGLRQKLIGYGYGMLSAAVEMRLLSLAGSTEAFVCAGEALEGAVRDAKWADDSDFNTVLAAASYHLGKMNARAYILVNKDFEGLSPAERLFVAVLMRRLDTARLMIRRFLQNTTSNNEDRFLGKSLSDISGDALVLNYHLSIGALMSYFATGDLNHLKRGRARLSRGSELSVRWGFAATAMLYDITALLFDDFETQSYHAVLPSLPVGASAALRSQFIEHLASLVPAQVDLWPSQIESARKAFTQSEDLVVVLPTSAGKTRIAELAMIPVLADGRDVLYITPLRALSAQVERELSEVFSDIGFSVSRFYDATMWQPEIANSRIRVATPEKLDFSLRRDPSMLSNVGLIIFDEAHLIGTGDRELRYELLIERLRKTKALHNIRIICLSALLGSSDEDMRRFATWISDDQASRPIVSQWRPTRRAFGTMSWQDNALSIDIERFGDRVLVEHFVESVPLPMSKGQRKPRYFPGSDDWEIVLAAAFKLAGAGESILIYNTLKISAKTGARSVIELIDRGALRGLTVDGEILTDIESARIDEWLGADHEVTRCLKMGIAIHHGDLPFEVLSIVERMIADRRARITIASPSIAQGINIAASTIIFRSIYRFDVHNKKIGVIPLDEFLNVVGRAGRAFIDIEGEVLLNLGKDGDPSGKDRNAWHELVNAGRNRRLESGLLQLIQGLLMRVGAMDAAAIDFITRDVNVSRTIDGNVLVSDDDFNADVDALDDAITAMLAEEDPTVSEIAELLDKILAGSFLARCIATLQADLSRAIIGVIRGRAESLIERYSAPQRRSAYLSGIKVRTSAYFQALLDEVGDDIRDLETQFSEGRIHETFIDRLTVVAVKILASPCFSPSRRILADVPDQDAVIRRWLSGEPLSLIAAGDDGTVAFVDEALRYRVVWGFDALRAALDDEIPERPVSLCFMYGVPSSLAVTMMRARLGSRSVAVQLARLIPRSAADDWSTWLIESGAAISEEMGRSDSILLDSFLQAIRSRAQIRNSPATIPFRPTVNAQFTSGELAFVFPGQEGRYEVTNADLQLIGYCSAPRLRIRPSGEKATIQGRELVMGFSGASGSE